MLSCATVAFEVRDRQIVAPYTNGYRENCLRVCGEDLVRELYDEKALAQVLDTTPLRRLTSAEETADFILLLASEQTAFITGQTIVFDGGRVMR